MNLSSDFMRTIEARQFVHQCTDVPGLDALAAHAPVTAYVGYDLTADSLHVGHLVSIMMLRTLQRTGHRPIALVGGGTTKVGDPSGKDESRQLLTGEQIACAEPAFGRRASDSTPSREGGRNLDEVLDDISLD